jgi:tetratricopeptide (TPR) repeat protein
MGDRAWISGAALERSESWPAPNDAGDVALTPDAARLVAASTTRARGETTFGREAIVAALAGHARAAAAGGVGLLVTLRGEPGVGKTRVARDLVARLAGVADVEHLPRGATDPRPLARDLRARAAEGPRVAVLDDAHTADGSLLDAVELATMDPAPLVVIVVATSALDARRPTWGFRATEAITRDLPRLDPDAARAMIAERLRPAEHVPATAIDAIAREAVGHPATIAAITDALHRAGAVRASAHGSGHYLAADEVPLALRAASAADGARDVVLGLAPGVVRLAELLAVFDAPPSRARVEACADDLGAALDVDVGVGLERLARAGVTRAGGEGTELASPALRRGLLATAPPAWIGRAHAAAYAAHARAGARDAASARHALAAGLHDDARAAFAALARAAIAEQRPEAAEEHATAALAITSDAAAARELRVLRARARYRMQRFDDALADLDAARGAGSPSPHELAAMALEEATIRDWMHDVDGSAASVDRAASIPEAWGDAVFRARHAVARGRTVWRRGALEDAQAMLAAAMKDAAALGDDETAIIAGLILGSALVYLGRLDDAARTYDGVVARCEAQGDRFHLAVACSNRLALWTRLRRADHAESDLRRAVRIARELGNAQLERIATHNLGELLYLRGDLRAALPLARRSLELQRRFFAAFAIPNDALLVARVLAVAGEEVAEARALLDDLDARWPPGARSASVDVLVTMTRALLAGDAGPSWDARIDAARDRGVLDEHAEVLHASVLAAVRASDPPLAGVRAVRARRDLAEAPGWIARIDALVKPHAVT